MTAFQLSFLPNDQPIPISDRPSRQKSKERLTTRIIESCCSTQRAAELLRVSTSTLYRARNAGIPYQKDAWTAKAIGANAWTVTHKG
jgi:hypothetical protein